MRNALMDMYLADAITKATFRKATREVNARIDELVGRLVGVVGVYGNR